MFDFHIHSVRSDGYCTPEELIQMAVKSHLSAIAITDHNIVLPEYDALCKQYQDSIRLINGSEISSIYTCENGEKIEVHIIALGFESEYLSDTIDRIYFDRRSFVNEIRRKLMECGILIPDYDTLKILYPEHEHLGRTQIADYMVKNSYSVTVDEAMDEYIGTYGRRKAFVNVLDYANYDSMETIVQAVLNAGGIPVLAHPFQYHIPDEDFLRLIEQFIGAAEGAPAGIEVFYRKYSEEQQKQLMDIAQEYGLFVSRASDYHGRDNQSMMDKQYPGWNTAEKTVYDLLIDREGKKI